MTGKAGFSENQSFNRVFLLKNIQEYRTRQGKPYLALVLGTAQGEIEARVWDMAMSSLPGLDAGDPVRAEGSATSYQDRLQLNVDRLEMVSEPVDPRELYPGSRQPEAQLRQEFSRHVSSLSHPDLVRFFDVVTADDIFMDAFFLSPAAVQMHHARIGGLAEHSIGVCDIARAVAGIQHWLSEDLLITGGLLHDIGKIREYEIGGDFRYSMEGRLVGHISLGLEMARDWMAKVPELSRETRLDIAHLILGHHGRKEFGSPVEPATPEALVVHYADDLDAKLDMLKTAADETGSGEAYVRGLRRMFVFGDRGAGEEPPAGRPETTGESSGERSGTAKPDDQGKLF